MKTKIKKVFMAIAALILIFSSSVQAVDWSVAPVSEWTDLFNRQSGWTGGDAVYSFQLNGEDVPEGESGTVFVFGDTPYGDILEDGSRSGDTVMINNSAAFVPGGIPDPATVEFLTGEDTSGNVQAIIVPDTPNSLPGEFYWPQDGFVLNNHIYVFMLRMYLAGPGSFDFEIRGVALVKLPKKRPPYLPAEVQQFETALFDNSGNADITFGSAILNYSESAGFSTPEYSPDGYIYVYGIKHQALKKLLAARVPATQFETPSAWRFWNGADWGVDITASAPIADTMSAEFSITPLNNGKFIMIFSYFTFDNVSVRLGTSPIDFNSNHIEIYQPSESTEYGADAQVYAYNAKGHPAISGENEILISYNVNTFDWPYSFNLYGDIYRPRFIKLSWTN